MNKPETLANVFAAQTGALIYNLQPDVFTDNKAKQQKVENCLHVEWEQDMGRKIPFCKITGEYCNGQCKYSRKICRESILEN